MNSQFSGGRGKEVFFVNLEEGFFGCQVNETAEVLQIFKIKSDKLLLFRKKEFQKKISMETKLQGQAITETEKNFLNA